MTFNLEQRFIDLGHTVVSFFEARPLLATFVTILLSVIPLIIIFPSLFALATWLERKGMARIQNRLGPNRVGVPPLITRVLGLKKEVRLFGLGQPAADGIKMLLKEDIVPAAADKFTHFLAPVLVVIPAFLVLAFLPFGEKLVAAGMDSAVIMFFALESVSTLAVFLAGWSSRNKYSLLGAMRAVAQMVSYEIPLVLAAVPPLMYSGSLNTSAIVAAQQYSHWFIATPWGIAGFLVFFVSSLAETNRSPFDLPEADSEIIAGHLTEYSGFKYALFFLAEYINMFAISGLAVTLFLGGWAGPLLPGFVWFFAKMLLLILIMIWIRGTLPRLRVDQLMGFAWKYLLPLALINILVAGFSFYVSPIIYWPVGCILLLGAHDILGRLNRGAVTSKRIYRYAS
jgi:NADH-quinone oxidoreductase subunit H